MLPFDIKTKKFVEIKKGGAEYGLLLLHIAQHQKQGASFRLTSPENEDNDDSDDDETDEENSDKGKDSAVKPLTTCFGHGVVEFDTFENETLFALHQRIGDPVGTNCGVDIFESLILFTSNESVDVITNFVIQLLQSNQKSKAGTYRIFKWHMRHEYWQRHGTAKSRSLDSVILPSSTIDPLMLDLRQFLAPAAKKFYSQHGIPYRRSYLFYGVPGAGKTSLIQALAGEIKKNVCILQPSHPDMTDDGLQNAITNLPANSIVVLEDVDALFAKDRSSKVTKSQLTFSGLLNALDGVGSSNGQLFILTTNLRNELDSALIRPGRVDKHVSFDYATAEQMSLIWKSYYPDSPELGAAFAEGVAEQLISLDSSANIAAAELQNFFLVNRLCSAEEALLNIGLIGEERRNRNSDNQQLEKEKKEKEEEDKEEKGEEENKETTAGKGAAPSMLGLGLITALVAGLLLGTHTKR